MNKKTYLHTYGFFIFFFIFFSIVSLSQEQGDTWAKIYGSLKYDTATSVIKTSDGNYLIGGVTDTGLAGQRFGFGSSFVLLKIEPSGRIIWCKKYGDKGAIKNSLPDPNNKGLCGQPIPGKGDPKEIIETKDCSYAVIAYSCLLKLNKNGDILWAKKYDCINRFTSIQELEDGGFITCGNTDSMIPEYATLAVIRLDKEGNILWSKAYEGEEILSHHDHYFKIRVLRNGDFILGGYKTASHNDMKIIKLDFQGKVKWSKIYKSASTSQYNSFGFYSLCITKNDEIIASMHCRWRPQHTGQGSIVVKLNKDGHIIWSECIISPYHGYDFHIQDANCLENGEIVLVGSAKTIIVSANSNLNALAVKMEQNGSMKWMKIQEIDTSRDNCSYVTAVTQSDDTGLLCVGASNSFSEPHSFDFFVVKMGEDGGVDNGGYFLRDIDFNDIKKVKMSAPQIESQNIDIRAKEGNCSWQDTEFVITDGYFNAKTVPKPELELALSDRGRALTSNLPIFVKENEVGNTNIDPDGDGIAQEWEDMAMEYINPYIELDEEEDWLIRRKVPHIVLADMDTSIVIPPLMNDLGERKLKKYGGSGVITTATDHVANFVRVHPYPDLSNIPDSNYHSMNLPKYIIFRYVVTWSFDYGRYGITEHVGDHERIFMAWKIIDNKTLKLEWVFTSSHRNATAHHGVWNAWHSVCNKGDVALSSKKRFHSEVMCSNLDFVENRLIFYASEDKHAIYPSCDICENVNLFLDMVGEDCGGGGCFMFDCYNVGEPPYFINPRVYDLSLNKEKLGEALPNGFLNKLLSRYRIQIKTGNKKFAGTDAKISIRLFGSDGNSPWYEIYSKPKPPRNITIEHIGAFEKGDIDNIYINSTDLGELNKIQIKHNNRGAGPGWYISDICIEDLETSVMWHSQPNTWLDKKLLHDSTNKTFNLDS